MTHRSRPARSDRGSPSLPPVTLVAGFERRRLPLDDGIELTQWVAPELGNSSYLLWVPGSSEAAVIDPVRDVDGYLSALPPGPRRKVVAMETHLHNDFLSGSRELQKREGAEIALSGGAEVTFPHRSLKEGDRVRLGAWTLETRETPGHTPEHVSYLLHDPEGRPRALFSGGALMVGAAGRTDLLGPSLARPLAHALYRSVHEGLRDLPDQVQLLPTHGAGSFCASGSSDRRASTLGEERGSNPLLRARTLEDFLSVILEQGPFPPYYRRMRSLNSGEAKVLGQPLPPPRALPLERFDRLRGMGAVIVDTREAVEYERAHLPGSYAIAEDGPLSAWVGWVLEADRPLLLLSRDEGQATDAHRQLFRIGFDRTDGYLAGGLEAWEGDGRAVLRGRTIRAADLVRRLRTPDALIVLDVREAREWFEGHVPGSLNIPLGELPRRMSELPHDLPLVVHCAVGYRAAIATSLLEQAGYEQVVRLEGGYEDWRSASRPPRGRKDTA